MKLARMGDFIENFKKERNRICRVLCFFYWHFFEQICSYYMFQMVLKAVFTQMVPTVELQEHVFWSRLVFLFLEIDGKIVDKRWWNRSSLSCSKRKCCLEWIENLQIKLYVSIATILLGFDFFLLGRTLLHLSTRPRTLRQISRPPD